MELHSLGDNVPYRNHRITKPPVAGTGISLHAVVQKITRDAPPYTGYWQ